MELSGRERRLLVILGAVVLLTVGYLVFLRLRPSEGDVTIPDLFPSPTVSAVVDGDGDVGTPVESPSATPTAFIVPAGARDPFKP